MVGELGGLGRIRAVLFDYDNTLVDSASTLPLAQRRVAEMVVSHLGNSVDVQQVYKVLARVEEIVERMGLLDRDKIWMHVLNEMGIDFRVDEELLREWSIAYWREYMKGPLFPETVHVLETLSKRYALGMVTNTDGLPGIKSMRLEKSGLLKYFKVVIIAGEDVKEIKPSPVPFLRAAELLDVEPVECVMVGDDPVNDIGGAKAAGFHAVLVDRVGGKSSPIRPDHVVRNLGELLTLFNA
ncbi:MAG: HAD family hydrolase [Candidatus Caldarchaeum sp.]|nr:HAD family hydrolase [Candidatus Caldarchaeum sp.]